MGMVLGFGTGPNAARENNKALKALTQDCDPGPMIEAGQGRTADMKLSEADPQVYGVMLLNFVEACLAAGIGGTLLDFLETIIPRDGTGSPAFWATIWLYKSRAHRVEEQWKGAAEAQCKAMEFFEQGGMTLQDRQKLQWWLCLNGYAIRIHHGQIEGLEEQIKVLFTTAPDNWHKAENHFMLGKLYATLGRVDEAKSELEYVTTHGNKLYAKTEAEDLLRELVGEGPNAQKRERDIRRQVVRELARMSETCDPTPALALCEAAFADEEIAREESVNILHWYACTALTNLGRYDEACIHLLQAQLEEMMRPREYGKLFQLHRQILMDTAQGSLKEAAEKQNEAMRLFREHGEPADWRRPLCVSGCSLQIKLGQLGGVEERTEWLMESAKDAFDRVVAHMLLGRYLLATERKDEAVEHLRYVAEHGGKLHQQREAEELLKKL